MRSGTLAVLAGLALSACSTSGGPVEVTTSDSCAHCRMVVSDPRLAAQIAAPGEDPVFFDDIGCLAKTRGSGRPLDVVYVADHRTGVWVRADAAIYSYAPAVATPMGSHILAHADDASRARDAAASGSTRIAAARVFEGTESESASGR